MVRTEHDIDPRFWDCRDCGATREELDDNIFPVCSKRWADVATTVDIASGIRRRATRQDYERLEKLAEGMANLRLLELSGSPEGENWSPDMELAIYPNPMRDDGVFVAQKHELQPVDAKTIEYNPDGAKRRFLPHRVGVVFPIQLPVAFARRVVACWNISRGMETDRLEARAALLAEKVNER